MICPPSLRMKFQKRCRKKELDSLSLSAVPSYSTTKVYTLAISFVMLVVIRDCSGVVDL